MDISLYWQCTLGYTDRSSLDHVYRTAHTACKLLPFDLHMPENLDLFPARYRRTTGDHSQRSLADTPPYMGMNLDMSTSFCCIQWRSLLIHFLNWFKKSEPRRLICENWHTIQIIRTITHIKPHNCLRCSCSHWHKWQLNQLICMSLSLLATYLSNLLKNQCWILRLIHMACSQLMAPIFFQKVYYIKFGFSRISSRSSSVPRQNCVFSNFHWSFNSIAPESQGCRFPEAVSM